MGNKITLRSYKMTHEGYNAPNFNNDILTNALCMGRLRQNWNIGEWMAGFSCKSLDNSQAGQEKLIYFAKVSQKLTLDEYWHKYPQKRPDKDKNGDNIYKPTSNGFVKVDKNGAHCHINDKDKSNIIANCVLVCDEFYYFGVANMIAVPNRKDIFVSRVGSIKSKCLKYRDNNGKLGGKGIAQNGSASSSCGSINQSSKTSKCQENKRLYSDDKCPPKNGKYEVELDTNFGTYYYEIGR